MNFPQPWRSLFLSVLVVAPSLSAFSMPGPSRSLDGPGVCFSSQALAGQLASARFYRHLFVRAAYSSLRAQSLLHRESISNELSFAQMFGPNLELAGVGMLRQNTPRLGRFSQEAETGANGQNYHTPVSASNAPTDIPSDDAVIAVVRQAVTAYLFEHGLEVVSSRANLLDARPDLALKVWVEEDIQRPGKMKIRIKLATANVANVAVLNAFKTDEALRREFVAVVRGKLHVNGVKNVGFISIEPVQVETKPDLNRHGLAQHSQRSFDELREFFSDPAHWILPARFDSLSSRGEGILLRVFISPYEYLYAFLPEDLAGRYRTALDSLFYLGNAWVRLDQIGRDPARRDSLRAYVQFWEKWGVESHPQEITAPKILDAHARHAPLPNKGLWTHFPTWTANLPGMGRPAFVIEQEGSATAAPSKGERKRFIAKYREENPEVEELLSLCKEASLEDKYQVLQAVESLFERYPGKAIERGDIVYLCVLALERGLPLGELMSVLEKAKPLEEDQWPLQSFDKEISLLAPEPPQDQLPVELLRLPDSVDEEAIDTAYNNLTRNEKGQGAALVDLSKDQAIAFLNGLSKMHDDNQFGLKYPHRFKFRDSKGVLTDERTATHLENLIDAGGRFTITCPRDESTTNPLLIVEQEQSSKYLGSLRLDLSGSEMRWSQEGAVDAHFIDLVHHALQSRFGPEFEGPLRQALQAHGELYRYIIFKFDSELKSPEETFFAESSDTVVIAFHPILLRTELKTGLYLAILKGFTNVYSHARGEAHTLPLFILKAVEDVGLNALHQAIVMVGGVRSPLAQALQDMIEKMIAALGPLAVTPSGEQRRVQSEWLSSQESFPRWSTDFLRKLLRQFALRKSKRGLAGKRPSSRFPTKFTGAFRPCSLKPH